MTPTDPAVREAVDALKAIAAFGLADERRSDVWTIAQRATAALDGKPMTDDEETAFRARASEASGVTFPPGRTLAVLQKLLHHAISDPGSFTPHRVLCEGWAGPEYESASAWSARAAIIAVTGYLTRNPAEDVFAGDALGRRVRTAWVAWALEQPDPKPSWLEAWEDLDGGQQEADRRIGEAVADLVSPEQMLRRMHRLFGLHGGWLPGEPTSDIPWHIVKSRWDMIDEEVNTELHEALIAGDLVKIADAIADSACALIGTAVVFGVPFDAVFREVMRSNMTKTNVAGQPKLVKGAGYEPPRVAAVLDGTLTPETLDWTGQS